MSDPVVDAITALRDEVREIRGDMVSLFAAAKGERAILKQAVEDVCDTVKRIESHNLEAHDRDGRRIRALEGGSNVKMATKSEPRKCHSATCGAK